MIVHAVDAYPVAQTSAYQQLADYSQPAAAPPLRVASSGIAVGLPPAPKAAAPLSHNKAPCAIQRGYADANGWGGVIAECDGSVVSVGGRFDWSSTVQSGAGRNEDGMRRVLLRSLEPERPGSRGLLLPSALMLILAALALFFVVRSFKEEPYRG